MEDLGSFKNGMNFDKSAMGHGHPFINLQNIFGKTVVDDKDLGLAVSSEKQRNEYNLLKGDILFIRSSVKPEGVGEAALVPKNFENTTFSGFIIRFRPHITIDDEFKRVIFATKTVRNQIMALATSSANTNINQISLGKIIIELPELSEQSKIGNLFKQLDNAIALHQRKVTLLKRLKEAYLTRMLPQNSENIPLLRFADYFDPWEQRKFEDLAESFNYGLNASAMEFDGENKYIRITDIDEYSHRFIQSGLTSPNTDLSNANDYLLKEGDILFARTGASVGKSYQYDPLDGKVYYAGFLIRARIKPEFDSSFIFQNTLTEKYNNFIKITSQRSGQPGVNAQEYANFSIMVPSRGEQVKLGNFFKQLDNAIALHQCKIEKLAKAKKVLLAAMFV